jgi:hypothetical protein
MSGRGYFWSEFCDLKTCNCRCDANKITEGDVCDRPENRKLRIEN